MLSLLALLCCPSLAHEPVSPASSCPQALARLPQQLLFQEEGAQLWAAGANYKLRASSAGIEYYPMLGRRAPRSLPLSFGPVEFEQGGAQLELAAPCAPRREGERLCFPRGPVRESWILAPNQVQHTIELAQPLAAPEAGELVLRLPVQTEQRFLGRVAGAAAGQGLCFDADGFARTSYSDARVVDARGLSIELPSVWRAGAIELRLPADFLAQASYPVLVDPFVTTVSVEDGSLDARDPDVAFDEDSGLWAVVYTHYTSGADADVYLARYHDNGSFAGLLLVESATLNAERPRIAIADSTNTFLVTYTVSTGLFGNSHDIVGRTYDASPSTLGAAFEIAGSSADEFDYDLGGSHATGGNFFVAWNEHGTLSDRVKGRRVSSSGALTGVVNLSSVLANVSSVSLSKSSGVQNGHWGIVFGFDPAIGADHGDIAMSVVNSSGSALQTQFTISDTASTSLLPAIAGDGEFFRVVYSDSLAGTERDLVLSDVRWSGSLSIAGGYNLSVDPAFGQTETLDQIHAALDTDGCRTTLVYRQGVFGSSNYSVFATTLLESAGALPPKPVEAHVLLESSSLNIGAPRVALRAAGGGAPGRSFAVWHQIVTSANIDIQGALYDWIENASVSFVPTGCGAELEPSLTVSGQPLFGQTLGFTLGGVGTPILALGQPIGSLPLCPGQASCGLGLSPILSTFPAAAVNFAIPCDAALLGATVAVQGFRLGGSALKSCAPPQWPLVLRSSDTAVVTL